MEDGSGATAESLLEKKVAEVISPKIEFRSELAPKKKNHLFLAFEEDIHVPGKKVDGVAILVIQEDVQIKSLDIKWNGKEFSKWGEVSKEFTETKMIFDISQNLWSLEKGDDPLRKGTHTFPFSWLIPTGVPGSFEDHDQGFVLATGSVVPKSLSGEKSRVSYTATVQLEAADSTNTLSVSHPFIVTERYDPSIKRPALRIEAEKSFFFNKAPMKMWLTIPNGGTAFSGYKMAVKFEIQNGTSKKLDAIRLTFYCRTTLNAKGESFQRKEQSFVGAIQLTETDNSLSGEGKPEGRILRELLVDIPATIEPSINAALINRQYEMNVELKASMSVSNLTFNVPIQIFTPDPRDPSIVATFLKNELDETKASQPVEAPKQPDPPKRIGSGDWSDVPIQ